MAVDRDIAAYADAPEVAALDLSAFSEQDILNTVLQRSEVLFDVPRQGRLIRAWSDGDAAPLRRVVEDKGEILLRRAIGALFREYEELRPVLDTLSPKRVADIGCGYAFFDLFLARDYGAELVLIDLEENDARHFGLQEEGAAYTSLAVARRFLEANGVPGDRIRTLNPAQEAADGVTDVDLAISFLSCGFHYPVSTYETFFRDSVSPDGAIILDLRGAAVSRQKPMLERIGAVSTLSRGAKWLRVLVRKSPAAVH